jgi:PIN domain nuclease of toxin-antitoxin system
VPDLPDRIVAATAVALRAMLISRDGKIRASQVQTIW